VAILGPITSPRKRRSFAVIDLEWAPARRLKMPEHTSISVDGMTGTLRVPLPLKEVKSEPLKVRLASVFDMVKVDESDESEDPVLTESFECFETVRELLDCILTSSNRGRWFYAHAGGLADMEFVLDEILKEIKVSRASAEQRITLADGDDKKKGITKHIDHVKGQWKIRASFSGSSAIIIHVARGKNAWHFVDSYWLLRDKLSNIGKSIKINKGDTPEAVAYLKEKYNVNVFDDLKDLDLEDFYRNAPLPVLTSYNRVDCEILWKAIAAFETEIWGLGGQLQMTIASTGMHLIRRSYLKQSIYTSERVNQIAEQTYYASRVEVLSRNVWDLKIYDINSSFPYAMRFPQPAGLIEMRSNIPEEWLDMADGQSDPDDPRERNIFLADVTIEVPDMDLPPVPYRQANRVFFPIGRWRAWLTSVDIRLALREGCTIHKVHEVYVFEPFMDLRNFADDIYGRRAATNDEFRRLVLKYLLNSPYGKFAEQLMKQEMLINPAEINRAIMQLLQPGVWLQEKKASLEHRHVPISTHITSVARRTLYDYGKECFRQGFGFHYCDTDSLATKADLPHDDKRLGALKLEKKLQWAEFIAPKIYRGEGLELKGGQWVPVRMTKAKGFSLGKTKNEAWERFEAIASGDRVGIQRMTRMRELYRSGETEPCDILIIKALTFEMLSKRFHYPDGETRPWHIKELVSGEVYPKGFDFEPDILDRIDTTTRAMIGAAL
jgi:hypothetical protein